MNAANWMASGLDRTAEVQGETSPPPALDPQTWLMSGIVAEREAEAAVERARVADLQARIDAVQNFKPRPIAPTSPVAVAKPQPAAKSKPALQVFRVTPELLDKHDAMERRARMSQFRASASLDAFDGVRDLLAAINNTNF